MFVQRYSVASEWLDRTGPILFPHEAEHNLMLGLAGVAVESPERFPKGLRMWTVAEGGAVVAAAFNTPPHNLILSRCSPEALDALVSDLAAHQETFPGVIGPEEVPGEFARLWAARTGVHARCRMRQRIHQCTAVADLERASGSSRSATVADSPMLERWLNAFSADVGVPHDPADSPAAVRSMIERNEALIWEQNSAPVSCARIMRRTPHGSAIAFVYTPPEQRGRGYATSCVAELTRQRLHSGDRFCCLYTDLANPTSNAIYARIGYRPVCDSDWWEFV